ncbi:MAG TPA: hypothetical protein VIO94_13310 [Phenylobacterium sp.]
MTQTITVKPVQGGWAVEAGLSAYPLVFLSGGQAERKARQLAEVVAAHGHDAEVLIHDRQSAPIGAFLYRAEGF